jgi:hypothetical protein
MTDLIERTRPDFGGEWTTERQQATLAHIAASPMQRHRGRRWLIGAAAATAAGAVAVPALLPGWFGTRAAAAELEPVASKVERRAGLAWGAGQFLHVVTASRQTGTVDSDRGPTPIDQAIVIDDWRDPDGWTWSRRRFRTTTEFYVLPPIWGWMRPGYAATMPTEPHALDLFLRARVSGSSSQDEAVFAAIGDMLKQEAAPPALRAAAIRVLGMNPRVAVAVDRDPIGRPALRATFRDERARPGVQQSLYIDPDSGALLGDDTSSVEGEYRAVITQREVVDALPASIVKKLGTDRVPRDSTGSAEPYTPMPDPTPHPSETYSPAPEPTR